LRDIQATGSLVAYLIIKDYIVHSFRMQESKQLVDELSSNVFLQFPAIFIKDFGVAVFRINNMHLKQIPVTYIPGTESVHTEDG
jgi:hypothetical protein